MRRIYPVLITIVLLLSTSCANKGYIKVNAVEGLIEKVSTRHDAYINADDSLSDLKKRVALRSTTLLRDIVAEAKNEKATE